MNKQELKDNLDNLGVDSKNYSIDGHYKDSSWVLECESTQKEQIWKVFQFERGKRYEEKSFFSESEACTCIYDKLKALQSTLKKFNLKHF